MVARKSVSSSCGDETSPVKEEVRENRSQKSPAPLYLSEEGQKWSVWG